ncbi:hypothetical protein BUALT_Bualt10G0109700 [Buddleja alternifolia]|uniref:Uncharacterized protein n=1 Tax=Buddleja alternifolia TaxID=168488 RepID=A0AAV6WZI5_9LAMI|nr:hypothetical protein BUALT_Bualt10G0109700 [Buddleja alternifolia]
MASSPPPSAAELAPTSAAESQLSSLVYDISQNMQAAMDNMLKMINEIDHNSAGIMEEIEKSKDVVLQRKITLQEEKDHFQKAAFAVLDMLNTRDVS